MGKWSVQYVRRSIQKHRMKWLYVINVGKVNRFFSYFLHFKRSLISFLKEDVDMATTDCEADLKFHSS